MSSHVPEGSHSTTTSGPPSDATLEMASVLFMDIVGYSLEPIERQTGLLRQLQAIARDTEEFQRAHEADRLIRLPTGDGFALVFFELPTVPMECALKISRALKARPDIRLRMGVHTGPVYRVPDINKNMNVAGGGISMAQRVMDCGDAGHIMVSSAVADVLNNLSEWAARLKDLGVHSVKGGVRLHLYALDTEDVANHEIPSKLRAKAVVAPSDSTGSSRRVWIGAGVAALVAGAAGWKFYSGLDTPAATPAAERSIAWWVMVQKFRDGKPFDQPFRLAQDINFEANYRIQLGFSSPQSGYLYLVNEGPELKNGLPDYHILFPSPVMNDGSAHVAANSEIHIPPDGKEFIRFDDQEGTEKVWVIWAQDELPALASVLKAASFTPEDGGSIKDPAQISELSNFLKAASATPPRVSLDEAAGQSVIKGSGDVLVHLRRLEHH